MYYEIKAFEKLPIKKVSNVGQSKKPKRDDWKRERRQDRKNKQARRFLLSHLQSDVDNSDVTCFEIEEITNES
jgi:hypothetical protein